MSAAPGSSPRGPSTRHLVRVYAYLAKHYGLSEFMLQTSAPANVGSCSQPVDTGRAHREARERAHMALRHAFPARNTRDFIYAVNNAAHLRALLLHARPSLPAMYAKALALCSLVRAPPEHIDAALAAVLGAHVCELASRFSGAARAVAFARALDAASPTARARLPSKFDDLRAVAGTLTVNSPRVPPFLRALDALAEEFCAVAAKTALAALLDRLSLDCTWIERMDAIDRQIGSGEYVHKSELVKRGLSLMRKGLWVRNAPSPLHPQRDDGSNAAAQEQPQPESTVHPSPPRHVPSPARSPQKTDAPRPQPLKSPRRNAPSLATPLMQKAAPPPLSPLACKLSPARPQRIAPIERPTPRTAAPKQPKDDAPRPRKLTPRKNVEVPPPEDSPSSEQQSDASIRNADKRRHALKKENTRQHANGNARPHNDDNDDDDDDDDDDGDDGDAKEVEEEVVLSQSNLRRASAKRSAKGDSRQRARERSAGRMRLRSGSRPSASRRAPVIKEEEEEHIDFVTPDGRLALSPRRSQGAALSPQAAPRRARPPRRTRRSLEYDFTGAQATAPRGDIGAFVRTRATRKRIRDSEVEKEAAEKEMVGSLAGPRKRSRSSVRRARYRLEKEEMRIMTKDQRRMVTLYASYESDAAGNDFAKNVEELL